jgi:hypothetical protein
MHFERRASAHSSRPICNAEGQLQSGGDFLHLDRGQLCGDKFAGNVYGDSGCKHQLWRERD